MKGSLTLITTSTNIIVIALIQTIILIKNLMPIILNHSITPILSIFHPPMHHSIHQTIQITQAPMPITILLAIEVLRLSQITTSIRTFQTTPLILPIPMLKILLVKTTPFKILSITPITKTHIILTMSTMHQAHQRQKSQMERQTFQDKSVEMIQI